MPPPYETPTDEVPPPTQPPVPVPVAAPPAPIRESSYAVYRLDDPVQPKLIERAPAALTASAPPAAPVVTSPPAESSPPHEQQEQQGLTERRSRYLEYLKACLRQQRTPAPEVVEVARMNLSPTEGSIEAASLISLQIRTVEEQLGIALPAPTGEPPLGISSAAVPSSFRTQL